MPSILMLNLTALGFPMGVRDLQIAATLAMRGAVVKGECFQGVWQANSRAMGDDAAMLWRWRPWHEGTSILTDRRILADFGGQHTAAENFLREGRLREARCALQPVAAARWRIVEVLLTRRARRWAEDLPPVVASLHGSAQTPPPHAA